MNIKDYELPLRSLFKNNHDGVIFYNKSTIIDANKTALDIHEVDREEFIGHDIYEFTLNKEKTLERTKKRLQGIPETYEAVIKTKSGIKEIEVSATPIDHQNITSYSIIRDITERKQTERRYRLLLERSPDLIFVTNQSGVLYINPAGVKYLGYQHGKR